MTIEELKKIIAQGESETLEFKTSTAKIKAIFQTLCAFLNGSGGIVLIGVNDSGKIIGQEISDATKREIAQEITKIEPAAQLTIEYIDFQQNKKIICIQVGAGNHSPYIYDARPYQRIQSTTDKVPQHRYEQMIVERGQLNHSWESVIEPNFSVEQLDVSEIKRTISAGEQMKRLPPSVLKSTIEEVLERLSLAKTGNINRAAVVLFGKDQYIYPHCEVKMARFRGTEKTGDFIDNRQVKGHAFKLLDEANAFMDRHLPIEGRFEKNKLTRINKSILPILAIREALVNAIIHRDYSRSGTSIQLAIYDDRLEIWNFGSLPKELSVKALRTRHQSILRNEIIANIFYIRDFVEAWGTGTNKMINLCRDEGLPEPVFEENTGGLMVIFKFKTSLNLGAPTIYDEVENKLSKRQKDILTLIRKEKCLSTHDLIQRLNNPPSERMIRKDLKVLKELKLIILEGHGRSAVWMIGA